MEEAKSLLELQLKIDQVDAKIELSGRSPVFQQYPRQANVAGRSLITTLFYCYFYHIDEKEDVECSPAALRKVGTTCSSSDSIVMLNNAEI